MSKTAAKAKEPYIKPLLKWLGGKTQIMSQVVGLFPNEIHNYHEPFVGGGSVLLAMLSSSNIHVSGRIYASDLNQDLIWFYINVQSAPDAMISELNAIVNEYNTSPEKGTINRTPTTIQEAKTSRESYYYWIRSLFNFLDKEQRATPRASAMLLFMNKTCFRGVYREGPNGFNVPFGHYKQSFAVDELHIRTISQLIQPVIFTCCSFQTALSSTSTGDFIYVDPPYAPENKTSFVSYNYSGFDIDSHKQLFQLCRGFTLETRIKFLMSNANVDMVTSAFPSPAYFTQKINCKRAIHSKDPGSQTTEVLITNYCTDYGDIGNDNGDNGDNVDNGENGDCDCDGTNNDGD